MKRDQTNVRRRVKEAPAGNTAGTARRSVIGARRRIVWHLYQARHDQSEALAWAQHDFASLADWLGDEAAPMLAVTEDLWDEAQAEARGAGLPDDEDENEIRAAISRLTDAREIRLALSAFERLKRGHGDGATAMAVAS